TAGRTSIATHAENINSKMNIITNSLIEAMGIRRSIEKPITMVDVASTNDIPQLDTASFNAVRFSPPALNRCVI
ncbi:MAG: hypothetical protein QXT63_03910, partial [Thermoplasmata archaeon]